MSDGIRVMTRHEDELLAAWPTAPENTNTDYPSLMPDPGTPLLPVEIGATTRRRGLSRSLLNFASGGLPVSAPRSSILRHVSNRTVGRGQRVQGADQVA